MVSNRSILALGLLMGAAGCGDILRDGTFRGPQQSDVTTKSSQDGTGATTGSGLTGSSSTGSTGGTGTSTSLCVPIGAVMAAPLAGGTITAPVISLALDSNDNPTVAWSTGNSARATPVFVSAWTGKDWHGYANSNAGTGIGEGNGGISLALDSAGQPAVAWMALSPNSRLFFQSWNGSSWGGLAGSDAGMAAPSATGQSVKAQLVLNSSGEPVIVYAAAGATLAAGQVNTVSWSNGSWASAPVLDTASTLAPQPALAINQDVPTVSYISGLGVNVDVMKNSSWTAVSSSLNGAQGPIPNLTVTANNPVVALKQDGTAVVAWENATNGVTDIYVGSAGASQLSAYAGSTTGTGVSDSASGAEHPTLVLDAQDNPIVAWEDLQSSQIFMKRWNGAAWVAVNGSASGSGVSAATSIAEWPTMRLTSGGNLVFAWHENNASVRVCSWAQ